MKSLTKLTLATISFLCSALPPLPSSAGEPVSKQVPARVELHQIHTLTLSDAEFLKGESNDNQVSVSGQLRIAQGLGRLPVVMILHGSGGIGSNIDIWSREFNEMGISTFVIDSFTGRGLTNVNSDQAALGRLNMILDSYRALEILIKHPRVDPSRIALMGFSRGGQATLYASLKRFHQTWNRSGLEFAAYLPFYPDCMTTYVSDSDVADRPIRIFLATLDDYNPAAPCKAFVTRLQGAGRDIQFTEYPNASHAFDVPLGSLKPAVMQGGQTVRNCTIREEPVGQLINAATKVPFTYKDPCVELGPHLGYDPAATQSAKQTIKKFLNAVFKLE